MHFELKLQKWQDVLFQCATFQRKILKMTDIYDKLTALFKYNLQDTNMYYPRRVIPRIVLQQEQATIFITLPHLN